MKLSRRCFLSFAIGGTAGTLLSPLPWKLTDDLSIWSQNWPWTPVPPDGAAAFVDSTCTLCPAACGIRVRLVDQRAVKIEGRELAAVNESGGLCPLGLSGLQLLYGPTRVKGPLKRVGDRGQGQWQSITWRQAIDEVVMRLSALRSQGNPESVACLAQRDSGTVPGLLKRLLTAYGSSNFYRMPSTDDALQSVLRLTQGVEGFAGLDVLHSDFILSFGAALLDGYGAPSRMMSAIGRLKEQHGKLVQIESRLSNTAAKSDEWLAANPGSEADLALAMAQVIVSQRKYPADFVSRRIEGFEAFSALLNEKFKPEDVAEKTGIEADRISRIALAFAAARHPLAVYGRGKGQVPGSLKEALAVHALNALVGSINRQGGVIAWPGYDYLNWPDVALDETASTGLQKRRLDGAGDQYPQARYLVNHLIESVNKTPGAVNVLLVADANPCYALPDTGSIKAAFSKIPFVVSFSSYMDETALQSDLILPNHVYLERFEDVPFEAGSPKPMIGLCQPVVAPIADTRHLGDTVIQIAHKMQGSVAAAFPWADYETCLQETLGDQWQTMRENGYWELENALPDDSEGKLVLMNGTLGAIYLADAPVPAGDEQTYPLLLMPYDSIRLASRAIGSPPFMMKIVEDTVLKEQAGFVALNPETARKSGLAEQDTALLKTPVGQASVRIHLNDGIMPGILAMPRGLGHTAYDAYLAGKGVNVNQLIAPMEDPASGLDAVWGIRANVTKA